MKTLLAILILCVTVQAGPRSSITKLTHRLTFTTLTENPVRPFMIKRSAVARFMKRVETVNAQTCWPAPSFEEQAASIMDEASDIDNAPNSLRIKRLIDYMKANLTDLRVVFFGDEPEWDIYVFGKDRRGSLVGFHYVCVV